MSLKIEPSLEAIDVVRDTLDNMSRANGVVSPTSTKLQIILDELLSNIVRHGYNAPETIDAGDDSIEVSIRLDDYLCTLCFTDGAAAFDPSQPVYASAADRPRLGGRGLDIVKTLSDSLTHVRKNSQNITTVTKAVAYTSKEIDKMAPGLCIEETLSNQSAAIALEGRIDSGNATNLTEHLTQVLNGGHIHLELNLAKLDYLTSAGFRMLLIVGDAAEELGGTLSLSNLNSGVQELFDLSGLSKAFQIN